MRIQSKRLKVENLFILGAGASYGLSHIKSRKSKYSRSQTPLDCDFIDRLREFTPHNQRYWNRKALDQVERNWLDRTSFHELGLERAIITRISQYEFLSKLHASKTTGKISNAEYLNNLSHLCMLLKTLEDKTCKNM